MGISRCVGCVGGGGMVRRSWRPDLDPSVREELRKGMDRLRLPTDEAETVLSDSVLLRRALRKGLRKGR